jgi:hypothetical protein
VTDHMPGDLEDRIRDAYQSAARTLQPQTLRRTSSLLTAGSVPPRRRMNAFAPIAAAIAVIVAIGLSVALPRMLTSDSSAANPATRGTSAAAPGHHPPFQVVTENDSNGGSTLTVDLAATGQVMSRLAPPPWHDAIWTGVAATADPTRFIVAAAPTTEWFAPTRLYMLILSARGTVIRLAPLNVPSLPGAVTSMAASADGTTVAYSMQAIGGALEVGVITGGRTRRWSVSEPAIQGIRDVSVSSDGDMIAFISGGVTEDGSDVTAWVLPTGSPSGEVTARARKVYDHTYVGAKTRNTVYSAVISPDARTLYLERATTTSPSQTVIMITAYSTTGRASPRTISTWDSSFPAMLTPVGGTPLILASAPSWFNPKGNVTAYLINPATRTRTTLRLRGIPGGQYLQLAW